MDIYIYTYIYIYIYIFIYIWFLKRHKKFGEFSHKYLKVMLGKS